MKKTLLILLIFFSLSSSGQVNTIAELKAYTGIEDTVTVSDSLQGGLFRHIDNSSYANSITSFPAYGKGVGVWQRIYSGGINILWAGAVADDTTDNWYSFTTLVNTAKFVHDSIFMPAGVFRITKHFNGNDSLKIHGIPGLSVIHIYLKNPSTDYAINIVPPTGKTWRNIVLDGITFKGTNENISSGHVANAPILLGDNATVDTLIDIKITNCEAYYFQGKGLVNGGNKMYLDSAEISNNYIHHVGTPEMNVTTPGASGLNFPKNNHVNVLNNRFYKIGKGTNNDGDWALYQQSSTANMNVEGNTLEDCNGGFAFKAGTSLNGLLVFNNTATGLTGHGVYIDANLTKSYDINILNNSFSLLPIANGSGITFNRGCNGASVTGNKIDLGGSNSNGIVLQSGSKNISFSFDTILKGKSSFRAIYFSSSTDTISNISINNCVIPDTTFETGIFCNGVLPIKNITVDSCQISGSVYSVRFKNVLDSYITNNHILKGLIKVEKSTNVIQSGNY